jgi:hypothetical protein
MDEVRFHLFVRKETSRINRDFLSLTIFVLSLAILWLNDEFFGWTFLDWTVKMLFAVAVMGHVFLLFYSMNEKEKLDGKFIGYVTFSTEKILAHKKEFKLDSFVKIEFNVGDYDGLSTGASRSIEPKISNGVNNRLSIKSIDGLTYDFNFQLTNKNEFEKKMRDILIAYHLKDKISFLALIQLIGISDSYERIQEFKRELALTREGMST